MYWTKHLMRAGRFDRQIYVDLPDVRERKEIFAVHIAPLKNNKNPRHRFSYQNKRPVFLEQTSQMFVMKPHLIAARKNKKAVGKARLFRCSRSNRWRS